MIIPVKCVSCGCVLADKYLYYLEQVRRRKIQRDIPLDKVQYFTKTNMSKTAEGEVLDELKLTNPCCRRTMITHVDIE
jgi:DNA-directed RNA polymerase I, II, and III subunit RPABC5